MIKTAFQIGACGSGCGTAIVPVATRSETLAKPVAPLREFQPSRCFHALEQKRRANRCEHSYFAFGLTADVDKIRLSHLSVVSVAPNNLALVRVGEVL